MQDYCCTASLHTAALLGVLVLARLLLWHVRSTALTQHNGGAIDQLKHLHPHMLEQKLDLAVVVLRHVAALLRCIAEHMDGDYAHAALVLL
jgi:CHASE1-domain containing sensor protein